MLPLPYTKHVRNITLSLFFFIIIIYYYYFELATSAANLGPHPSKITIASQTFSCYPWKSSISLLFAGFQLWPRLPWWRSPWPICTPAVLGEQEKLIVFKILIFCNFISISIYKENEEDSITTLKLAKQRAGDIGKVKVKFNKQLSTFVNLVRWTYEKSN